MARITEERSYSRTVGRLDPVIRGKNSLFCLFAFGIILFFPCHFNIVSAETAARLSDDQIEKLAEGVQRHQLENGLVCIIKEDFSAPLVSIQLWVGSGSAQEEEYLGGGLSHLIEHMIFKGTPTRKPADISKEIDDAGGSINAYTSLDRTVFLVDIPAERWETGLDVLADAITSASFPENEWRREKDVIRREMAMDNDSPNHVLSKLLWQTAYHVHPYRFPVIGRENIFAGLTRDDLLIFFRRNYTPDNMIISVVGNINANTVRAAVENRFRGSGRRSRPPLVLPAEPVQLSSRTERKTGDYNVSRLEMAWHTVGLNHADAPALDILSIIAGSGNSSRLGQKIKEKLKLAFSIDAWSYTPKEAGLFGISAVFDPAKEKELIKAIEAEVAAWQTNAFTTGQLAEDPVARHDVARNSVDFQDRRTPCGATTNQIPLITYPLSAFSAAEVEKARNKVVADTLQAFQTMHGKADTFASGEFYAGTPFYFDVYLKRLAEVTPESLSVVANRYLRDQNRTLTILSPATTNTAGSETNGVPEKVDVVRTVLTNGLTLLCREDVRLPFVNICIASLGGLLLENEKNNGITCLMAEMLTRGTGTRSQEEIAETIESSGGAISSFSGLNSYGIQARCFSKDAELFMDILADCCLRSVFPEDEITKRKAIQCSLVERQRESPMFLAQEAMRKALFAGHPYRLNVEGTRESVMTITREDLRLLHDKTVTSSNTVIAVFGDISTAKAKELTAKFMGKMAAGARQEWKSAGDAEHRSALQKNCGASSSMNKHPPRIELTAPREQTIVLAGFPGLALADRRIDALNILLQALNGLSSDLMINVRDKKGLAYYTGAYHKAGLAAGQLVLYSGTRAEKAEEVCALIKNEIGRIGQGIRADEFERARRQIISENRQSRQVNAGIAMECALNELYGLGYAHGLETEKRLAQLTPEDVRNAAAEIMRMEKMVEVIVRPK